MVDRALRRAMFCLSRLRRHYLASSDGALDPPMKIAVIGAGAVGGYFGGRLALSGSEVVFLVRGKTFESLSIGPLRVQSIGGNFEVNVSAIDDPAEAGAVDAVLVAVKAWQVPEAAAAIRKMPGGRSVVVPL